MESERLKQILEAALLAAGRPLSLNELEAMFADDDEAPERDAVRAALAELADDWQSRSLALQQVASGWRAQVRTEFEPWLARLWEEKPPRYSRALLETLAVIAYRQPVTRPEIEEIRGVSISTQIMRTLEEREWVRIVGHRDTPGRPAMYGTTRQFLDYFNLRSLDQVPPITEIRDFEQRYPELALEESESGEPAAGGDESGGHLHVVTAPEGEDGEIADPDGETRMPSAPDPEEGDPEDETEFSSVPDEQAARSADSEDGNSGRDDPEDPEASTCTPAS